MDQQIQACEEISLVRLGAGVPEVWYEVNMCGEFSKESESGTKRVRTVLIRTVSEASLFSHTTQCNESVGDSPHLMCGLSPLQFSLVQKLYYSSYYVNNLCIYIMYYSCYLTVVICVIREYFIPL